MRAITLLRRARRARTLGTRFGGAASFGVPDRIVVAGKALLLHLPVDRGTRNAFIDIMLDDCYGLERLPDDVATVVDVGCHAGLFSIAARRRWPRASIHAYEPNQALREHWSAHASQADFSVFPEAVGFSAGFVSLVPGEDSVHTRTGENGQGEVPRIAFAEALARLGERIDVVKLDCEGAEWEILQDAESWRGVRFLTMEFHLWAGYSLAQLHERLHTLGLGVASHRFGGADFGILTASRR